MMMMVALFRMYCFIWVWRREDNDQNDDWTVFIDDWDVCKEDNNDFVPRLTMLTLVSLACPDFGRCAKNAQISQTLSPQIPNAQFKMFCVTCRDILSGNAYSIDMATATNVEMIFSIQIFLPFRTCNIFLLLLNIQCFLSWPLVSDQTRLIVRLSLCTIIGNFQSCFLPKYKFCQLCRNIYSISFKS